MFEFVKDQFPVPCQHPSCPLIHKRFFTASMDNTPYWETVDLPGGGQTTVRVTGFHEVTRTQWLVLLDGERYGDPYDTRKEAKDEAERLNAQQEASS